MCRNPDGTQRMPTSPTVQTQLPVTPVVTEIAAEPGVAEASPTTPKTWVPEAPEPRPEPRTEPSQDETKMIKPGMPPLISRQPRTRS